MGKNFRQCCSDYYRSTIPGQAGQGAIMLPRYQPMVGHGLFGSVFKNIVPFLQNRVLPNAIKGIGGIASDLISGRSFGESIKSRGLQALKDTIQPTTQSGKARKRKASVARVTKRAKGKKRGKRSRKTNAFGL